MFRQFTVTSTANLFPHVFEPVEEELPEFYEFIIIVHVPYVGNKIAFATCGDSVDQFHDYISGCGYDHPATLVVLDKDSYQDPLLYEICDLYGVDLNKPEDMYGFYKYGYHK